MADNTVFNTAAPRDLLRENLGLPSAIPLPEIQPQADTAPAARPALTTIEEFEAVGDLGDTVEGAAYIPLPAPSPGNEKSLRNFVSAAARADWAPFALARMAEDAGFTPDPEYRLPEMDSFDWKYLTEGIPQEYWENFGGAVSREHAYHLAERIKEELHLEAELATYGGWGIAGRIGVNVIDPVALLLMAGTGGLATASKGERLVNAVNSARKAGQFNQARVALSALEKSARGSAGSRALKLGSIAAAENMALEAILVSGSQTRDAWDVVNAGIGGLVLGTGISRLFTGSEKRAITAAFLRERRDLQFAELEDALTTRRAALLEKAGDPADLDLARSTLAELKAVDDEISSLTDNLGRYDLGQLDTRIAEVEQNIARLTSEGAGAEEFDDIVAGLRKLERELDGRAKQRRSLTQEIRSLSRKGKAVRPAEQEARAVADIRARLLDEDRKVWGDQADSPTIARKREKEVQKELVAWRKSLPGDPKVARLETRLQDSANAIERLNTEAARLNQALGLSADLRAAQRELGALQRTRAEPDAARARLSELAENKARLDGEAKRLESAGKAAQELDALDSLAARIRTLIELQSTRMDTPKGSSGVATGDSFGRDSGGAARFLGNFEGLDDEIAEATVAAEKAVGKTAFAGAQKAIRTFGGLLRGHDDEWVRANFGVYVGDSVGTTDGSVSVLGASEVGARLNEAYLAKFNSAVNEGYSKWRRGNGKGFFKALSRETRYEYMNAVGRAIKGETVDEPGVKEAASRIAKIFDDYRKEAQAAGVRGFETLEANPNYLPRVFNYRKLHELETTVGTPTVIEFFGRAIKAELGDAVTDEVAAKIAKGYVKRMKELRVGVDSNMMDGLPLGDFAYLRQLLKDSGETQDEVENIIGQLAAYQTRKGDDGGRIRYAKHRVKFDETFALRVQNAKVLKETGNYETVELKMSDFFDNNVEKLFSRYSRSMSGSIGMAKAAGVRSASDHQARILDLRKRMEGQMRDPDEIESLVKTADAAYKLVVGAPVEDATTANRWMRLARDWNFATTMNQAGFAQIPDLAGLITKGYLRHTWKHAGFRDLVRSFKRTDGSLDDALARETEEWLGLGTDYHNNAVFSAYDDMEEGFMGVLGTVEHGIRTAGRGTQAISGMAFITSMAQRLAGKAIIQRLVKESLEGGQISAKRLAQLGIEKDMLPRIRKQIEKHTGFVDNEVGGKVRIVNWSAWDDIEARDQLLYGVFREARRLVQEEDLADTGLWMHKSWGKMLAQFRRFALVSFTRQVLHGANHADAETATRVLMSSALAAASYTVQMEIKAGALEGQERDDFRESYLSPERIVAAAYARSSYSSLLPAMIDTATGFTLDYRFFDVRSSGQASDLLTGNPTFSLLNNIATSLSAPAQAMVRGDRQYKQSDLKALRRLAPFQNIVGADYLINPLIRELPKSDEDDDPENVDLSFW